MFRTKDNVSLFFQVIATALAIVVVVLCIGYGGWLYLTKDMVGEVYDPNENEDIDGTVITEAPPEATDNGVTLTPKPLTDIEILNERIEKWRRTGTPASQDNVTNILLIGIDTDSADMNRNSRADAMVIMSINHNTETITLASVMRDQYCYIENGRNGRFEKLHHANAYGGPSAQIRAIEDYYKISIDNYALVNFYSMPRIIDRLGGVEISVTRTEADYMNTYWGTDVTEGKNLLDGDTALIYMRIRHQTGGDEARVGRQQEVIKQIFARLKTEDTKSIVTLIAEITKYIRTGYTSQQMLALATDALVNGWFDYKVRQMSFPDGDSAIGFTVNESGSNVWYWRVDYPIAARSMQIAFYGKSNIVLEDNRKSWLK